MMTLSYTGGREAQVTPPSVRELNSEANSPPRLPMPPPVIQITAKTATTIRFNMLYTKRCGK
jgi:hypothetical protein